jgi:hypothetical protein
MPGRPFRSVLEPYLDFIRKERIARKSWREIAQSIRDQGTECTPQGVHSYFKRARHRKHVPLGFEQEKIKPSIYPHGFTPRTCWDVERFAGSAQEREAVRITEEVMRSVNGRRDMTIVTSEPVTVPKVNGHAMTIVTASPVTEPVPKVNGFDHKLNGHRKWNIPDLY